MDKPKPTIAGNRCQKVILEVKKRYNFCTCGNSSTQPFCNGSHKGGHFLPLSFIAEKEEAYLCLCKHTKTPPHCDGSHKKLEE